MQSRARPIARLVPAVVVLATCISSPGLAQIGGAINKAKQKATEAAVPAPAADQGCTTPQFDKDVLELNAERLNRFVQGVQAARAVRGPGGQTSAQLRERAAAAYEERDKLLEGKDEQVARHGDAESKWRDCHWAALDSMKNLHYQQAQQRLMAMAASQDAAALQGVIDAQTKASEASAAGDTVAANKATADYYKRLGFDFAKDTAEANRICRKPVKAAWHARADSLGSLADSLLVVASEMEKQAAAKGAETAGMGQQQFYIAQERIVAYVASDGSPGRRNCFSVKEREALNAELKELKALNLK